MGASARARLCVVWEGGGRGSHSPGCLAPPMGVGASHLRSIGRGPRRGGRGRPIRAGVRVERGRGGGIGALALAVSLVISWRSTPPERRRPAASGARAWAPTVQERTDHLIAGHGCVGVEEEARARVWQKKESAQAEATAATSPARVFFSFFFFSFFSFLDERQKQHKTLPTPTETQASFPVHARTSVPPSQSQSVR